MSDRVPQSSTVNTFHNHRRKANGTDLDSPQGGARQAIDAKTLSARTVRFCRGGKRRCSRLGIGSGRRLCILQGTFKLPRLIGLKGPPVEQDDGAVTQRQKAYDQKNESGPTDKQGQSRRLLFNFEHHGRSLGLPATGAKDWGLVGA